MLSAQLSCSAVNLQVSPKVDPVSSFFLRHHLLIVSKVVQIIGKIVRTPLGSKFCTMLAEL